MAFEGLAEKLSNSFKKLRSKGKLTEADVKEAMREVRLALLEADVNYKVAKEFTKKVTDRAVGSEVMESLTPAQMVIKIVNEELTSLMGGSEERLKMPAHPPAIIMMCGLQGAGKGVFHQPQNAFCFPIGSKHLLPGGGPGVQVRRAPHKHRSAAHHQACKAEPRFGTFHRSVLPLLLDNFSIAKTSLFHNC